ncbi:MAG: sodium:calcium antiporter [Dehalococcoidia bacterium]|nr:sodium:calcium antiporter [Dehalococcoidia bacterium]
MVDKPLVAAGRLGDWLLLLSAVAVGIPAVVLSGMITIAGGPDLYPLLGSFIFGAGIVGAAFLLAWGAEVAQLDISQALALAVVALVAVLPEYAVDGYLAWQAGADPASEYVAYATANMTGGNRLIVGAGWPLVVLLFWLKRREPVALGRDVSTDLVLLVVGALFSLSMVFTGSIALWHTALLFPLFGIYAWVSSRAEQHEPELVGPPAAIAAQGAGKRRVAVALMFLFAVGVILLSTELFAEGLIDTGKEFGIDEFMLIQWLAPLASESPEMLVAGYFAVRGNPGAALFMLISATVNQWSLLIGSLPIAYSLSYGAPVALPLTRGPAIELLGYVMHRQQVELLLTMAQTIFAVVLVLRLRVSWQGMAVLLGLFLGQLVSSSTWFRFVFAMLFLGLAFVLLLADAKRRAGIAGVTGYTWNSIRQGRKTPG